MSKIVICAIAKNEDRYVEDWLLYHFCLGFTDISIYDNNIPERKGDLRRLIDNSTKLTEDMKRHTEIIDATDKRSYQIEAYQKYHKTHKFDWCAFIDIDEFITLNAWKTIGEMVNDKRFADATAIFLAWDTISDDNIVDVPDDYIYKGVKCINIHDDATREAAASEWEKIPVYERFHKTTTTFEPYNHKMLVRGGIDGMKLEIHHYIADPSILPCYPSGKIKEYIPKYHVSEEQYYKEGFEYANLRHYRTKTIREYLRQKYLNKSSAVNSFIRTLFVADYFFRVNEKTAAKMEYYKKHHQPITCHILLHEEDYDKVNAMDLCYICDFKEKRHEYPTVISFEFLKRHINQIDKFVII